MSIHIRRWGSRAACVALIGVFLSGCGITDPVESNPNTVATATFDQLFTSIQVQTWFMNGGQQSRLASVFLQQMDGTDRQFQGYANYNQINEDLMNNEWERLYGAGGLLDMRIAIAGAEEAGERVYAGIIKVYQALGFGSAASIWGDIPFSEAANPEIQNPKLDEQLVMYDRMQALLDEAIADLSSGQGIGPGAVDFSFGGDAAAWIRVAHSLKARFHMHLAELNGSSAYQAALSEAQQGISSASGDWDQIHNTRSQENNLWFQFQRDRSGYISAGEFGVDWYQDRGDPRLSIFYTKGLNQFSDVYIGSPAGDPPGDPGTNSSNLNVPGQPDFDQSILTCAETQFIIAEAQFALGNEAAAIAGANAGIACSEEQWGVVLPDIAGGLTGAALLTEIMEQKYAANFLGTEIWPDYRRTCLPAVTPSPGGTIPARLVYPGNERESNSSVPDVSQQPLRNDNDPNPC